MYAVEKVLSDREACPYAGTTRQLNCGSKNRGSIWAEIKPAFAIAKVASNEMGDM